MQFSRPIIIWVLLAVVLLCIFVGGRTESGDWITASENEVVLGIDWSFSWRFIGEEIEFTLNVPTTGWGAIGFDSSRIMKDVHYIIGYVVDGVVFIRDDYGTGETSHGPDTSLGGTEDVRIISGAERDGKTTLVFALPKDSGDIYDTVFTTGSSLTISMTYGAKGADDFTSPHLARNVAEVKL